MNVWIRRTMGAGAGITLGLLAGAAVLAQSQASSPDSATQPQRKIQMVQAQATLDSTLDAKKAKQGEPVTAKLEGSVQIPDAQALPKNTVLEGHVDQVQASEHKSDSLMVVTFDKAKLKGGQELPIKATIIAVSEPAMMAQQAAAGTPASEGAPMPSSTPTGGGAPSGGGSMAGASPSAPSPQPMDLPAAGSGTQQTAQKTGVPDVTLKSDIHQHSSATFTSKGRNVHVPDGTQMQVALTIIPPGVTLQ
ncbi:MAG: hypothetical protein WCC27_02425 [Acidobacteriaceae bacterium]